MSNRSDTPAPLRISEMIASETGKVLPEQEAYLYLIRAGELLSGPVAALLATYNLSRKQYSALRSIRRAGSDGATVNEVRHQMTDLRADVTRLIDRLERDGLVTRKHDLEDRRVVRVILSEAGKTLLQKIDEPLLELHRSQFQNFGRDELELLKSLLMKVT